MRCLIPLLFLCLLTAGCQKTTDLDNEKAALMETDRQFSKLSVEKGRVAAFDAYMSDSVVTYRNNAQPFKGRKAFLELLSRGTSGTLSWEPTFADISASEDIGYTLGTSEFNYKDSAGVDHSAIGYYVTIWKRQADGSWKFVFDSGVQGPSVEK